VPSITTTAGPIEYREAGAGSTLLILHGTPGGSDQGVVSARLLGLRARIIAPSRPGYLGTPLATGRTPAEQAAAMVALLDELGVTRTAVLGVSGGGMSTIELAALYPSRVTGLVLWSAVSGPIRIPAWPLLHGPLSRPSTGEAVLRRIRRSPRLLVGPAADDDHAVDAALALAETVLPIGDRRDGLANDAHQARRFDVRHLAAVAAPTLIVHGAKDRNVPHSHAIRAAQSIPHAQLITVPGTNHWTTPADRTARAALGAFLEQIADGVTPDL
jgi:2-hydroxy-6-oxonona-2,4-dienedioate hydrolase